MIFFFIEHMQLLLMVVVLQRNTARAAKSDGIKEVERGFGCIVVSEQRNRFCP